MRLGRLRNEAIYKAVESCHEEYHWPIKGLLKLAGVSRTAYYKWKHRTVPETELETVELARIIMGYHVQYHAILGYRRMTGWINKLNSKHYSYNRVRRIMKALDIHSVIRRKARKYRKSTADEMAQNLLKRNFNATRPNEKWVTDVTEFQWYDGPKKHKLYLSVILDLYDRSVVSYVMTRRNNNNLVFKTFDQAMEANPGARPMLHSDRGFQYTGRLFRKKLDNAGITQSMSRVGHCIDNGPMEGFWGIIKCEMYYLQALNSEEALKAAVDEYVHFYNYDRLQERFDTRPPMEIRLEGLASETPVQYPIAENKRIAKYKREHYRA